MRGVYNHSPYIYFFIMPKNIFILFIPLIFLVSSCDNGIQGSLNENQLPTTSLTVNEINLPAGKRLVSQVDISWWGDDPDGYVVGYEFLIGDPASATDADWVFTEKTDSTFILPIPEGSIDADVQFTVRAIDNDDARDTDPPSLTFPIRNTKPGIEFKFNETPSDTTYSIMSFGFTPSDPDGNANLNRVEVALNDTSTASNWKELSLDIDFITLKIDDSSTNPTAKILVGRSAVDSDLEFQTVNLDGENTFYIRAIDNAAAVSDVLTKTWYVKKQTSRVLFLNDYFGTEEKTAEMGNMHLSLLNQVGITKVDYLDISDGEVRGGTRVPLTSALPDRSLADPTTNMILAQWDYIYWISDDLDRNIGYALELTTKFFENGGKMFINIPVEYLADRNPLFQFLPFKAVEQAAYPEGGRSPEFIIDQCTVVSNNDGVSPPITLRFKQNIFPAFPIIPFQESINLFDADFGLKLANPRENAPYDGNSLIATMNSDKNIIYFGIDFNKFTTPNTPETSRNNRCKDSNGDLLPPSDLKELVNFLTIETLGFQQ